MGVLFPCTGHHTLCTMDYPGDDDCADITFELQSVRADETERQKINEFLSGK
ncbi:hypothetical protein SARC_18062, partial [Sphaeroforma arctica JP610]